MEELNSASACTCAARHAAPVCAARPRGPPRARCPTLPRTQARADSVAAPHAERLPASTTRAARPHRPPAHACTRRRAASSRPAPLPRKPPQHDGSSPSCDCSIVSGFYSEKGGICTASMAGRVTAAAGLHHVRLAGHSATLQRKHV